MLAQSFKSAADLGLSEEHRDALIKTLVLLETGKLIHVHDEHGLWSIRSIAEDQNFTGHFNMSRWFGRADCGTVCCIGGTAMAISGIDFYRFDNQELTQLFYPPVGFDYNAITPEQAGMALRNYLTYGKAMWEAIPGIPKGRIPF